MKDMKDPSLGLNNKEGSPKMSKTMKTLQDLKKWKIWNISIEYIKKIDKEFDSIRTTAVQFQDNEISKADFDLQMDTSQEIVSDLLHSSYENKFSEKSSAVIWINRLPVSDEDKDNYQLAIWQEWEDALIEKFSTVDDVLDRMKDKYG